MGHKYSLSLVILGVTGRLNGSVYIRCCRELEQLFLNQFKYSDMTKGATIENVELELILGLEISTDSRHDGQYGNVFYFDLN